MKDSECTESRRSETGTRRVGELSALGHAAKRWVWQNQGPEKMATGTLGSENHVGGEVGLESRTEQRRLVGVSVSRREETGSGEKLTDTQRIMKVQHRINVPKKENILDSNTVNPVWSGHKHQQAEKKLIVCCCSLFHFAFQRQRCRQGRKSMPRKNGVLLP